MSGNKSYDVALVAHIYIVCPVKLLIRCYYEIHFVYTGEVKKKTSIPNKANDPQCRNTITDKICKIYEV